MEANILLGLSIYTLIGLAPLLYNYYVVTRRHEEARRKQGIGKDGEGKVDSTSGIGTTVQIKSSYPQIPQFNSLVEGKVGDKAIPLIILVVNPNDLKSDIGRLVVRYLTSKEKLEKSSTTDVSGNDAGVNHEVIGIASPVIAEAEA